MTILELITNINKQINTFLWDKLGLVLLILTGIIFTFATQFFQLNLNHYLNGILILFVVIGFIKHINYGK